MEDLPARQPQYALPSTPLSEPVQAALAVRGINQMFTHQAKAVDAVLAGKNVVVSTSTASGKSLCYNIPVLEALVQDRRACALYMFPTKVSSQLPPPLRARPLQSPPPPGAVMKQVAIDVRTHTHMSMALSLLRGWRAKCTLGGEGSTSVRVGATCTCLKAGATTDSAPWLSVFVSVCWDVLTDFEEACRAP